MESPWGGGRKEQGCRAGPWGARLGRKCPGAWLPPPPMQRLLSADTDPWKAPSAPFAPTWGGIFWVPQVRPHVPEWARLPPADDVLQGLNWSPAVDTRGPDEGSSSRLSVCAPGDDLYPHPHPCSSRRHPSPQEPLIPQVFLEGALAGGGNRAEQGPCGILAPRSFPGHKERVNRKRAFQGANTQSVNLEGGSRSRVRSRDQRDG